MSDSSKQKMLLGYLLSDKNLFTRCSGILKPIYFDSNLRPAVKFMLDYVEKYRDTPTVEQIKVETSIDLVKFEVTKAQSNYAAEEIAHFCRNSAVEAAIFKAAGMLDNPDFGIMIEDLKNAISVGLQKDLGLDYFDDPEKRIKDQMNSTATIPTGWHELDDLLGGGISRQEITLFMANSGVGKSILMSNLAVNFLQRKMNVLYITLELAETVVGKRFDSMITGVGQRDIFKNIQKVAQEINRSAEVLGKLTIKRMPESIATANDVRAYLKEFETVNGYIPDLVVLDYMDLMMPARKVSMDNLFVKDKFVAEECRAVAAEFDCCMISASQAGRAAIDAEEHTQGHIQGGYSKVQTADNLIMIIQSDQMRDAGEYVLKLLKTRSSNGVGKQLLLGWDAVSLRVTNPNKTELKIKPKRHIPADDLSDVGSLFDKSKKPDIDPLLALMRT